MSDNINFEENLKEIEKIIEKLNDPDCSLDESIALFEKGIGYMNSCRSALKIAEEKIKSFEI